MWVRCGRAILGIMYCGTGRLSQSRLPQNADLLKPCGPGCRISFQYIVVDALIGMTSTAKATGSAWEPISPEDDQISIALQVFTIYSVEDVS